MKIAFVISSAINVDRLVGTSIFDTETRYRQTIDTINSIKLKIPNSKIFLNETNEICKNYKNTLINIVDDIFVYDRENIKKSKSGEEAFIMAKAFNNKRIKNFDFVFKLSGRYVLNENFNPFYIIESNKNKIIAKRQSHAYMAPHKCFNTVLYCVGQQMLEYAANSCEQAYTNMFHDIEHSIFRDIEEKNFINLEILGVEGLMAPTGEFFKG